MAGSPLMYAAGKFLPEREAAVSASDAGLLLGAGLFETLRTYGPQKKPFRLAQHLARLRASGQFFRIFVKESDADIAEIIAHLVKENGLADARLRITATRGALAAELDDDSAPAATLLLAAGPMTPYPAEWYARGATVVLSDIRVSETDPAVYHKTTNYLTNLLALRDAHRAGAAEALFFNSKNRLAEGAISNVFLVQAGGGGLAAPLAGRVPSGGGSGPRLLTPPVEEGLLAGVTRAAVLELAAEVGVPAEQRPLAIDDLLAAEEVFLTNSIMEIMPLARVERHEVGTGAPGPVTGRLAAAYQALVARECG